MAAEKIRVVSMGASESETVAIVAAIERFLADTAPPPADVAQAANPWARAALAEGIAARQLYGDAWGHSPPPR